MPQSDNTILTHSPAYLIATVLSATSTALSIFSGEFALAIFLAAITALLILSRLGKGLSPKLNETLNQFRSLDAKFDEDAVSTPRRLSIVLAALALAIIWVAPEESGVWIYSLPLMLMFFFEFKIAMPILLVTSLLSIGILSWQDKPLIMIQAIPSFILLLGASCALVYLRELRRRQLKPLRRTDSLSHAASRQHLDEDLQKEIQRSEREGSDLSLIAIRLDDAPMEKFSIKEHDHVQIELGKLLHNNLRAFDSYYRLEQHLFLVVLPHTSSQQAHKIADSLRLKIKNDVKIAAQALTSSSGISYLNVGDDSYSLVQHACTAQQKASSSGGNRSYLFSDRDLLTNDVSNPTNAAQTDSTSSDKDEGIEK